MMGTGIRWVVRLATLTVVVSSLSGCFKVDADNDKVVAALEDQNQLLEERNQSLEEQKASITLYGNVIDYRTQELVSAVDVQVRQGVEWGEVHSFSGGTYEVVGVAPQSDFELKVSSPTGEFADRVMLGLTGYASEVNVFQALENIPVAPEVTRTFSIRDTETGDPISGLTVYTNTVIGNGPSRLFYSDEASYDSEAGTYSMSFAGFDDIDVFIELDRDDDGESDFMPIAGDTGSSSLRVSDAQLENGIDIELARVNQNFHDVAIKLTVMNEDGDLLADVPMHVSDGAGVTWLQAFNPETGQYEVTVMDLYDARVDIPAHVSGETSYGSATVEVSYRYDGYFHVWVSGSANYISFDISDDSGVIQVPVTLRERVEDSQLELVTRTFNENQSSSGFFYSEPVALRDDSVALYQTDVVSVIRGNDSTTDLILPGTTMVSSVEVQLPVNSALSLDNTLLTLTPANALQAGSMYRYEVGPLKVASSGLDVDLSGDTKEFRVSAAGTFDINDVYLDNANYWTNGALIVAANTAGIASTASDYSAGAALYFPKSIESLNYLAFSKRIVTKNGSAESDLDTYYIVREDSNFSYYDWRYVLHVANNESLLTDNLDYYYVNRGAAVPEGVWRTVSVSEYMSDNTDSSINTIQFEYVYETRDGEVVNGTITLPVQ